MEKWRRFLFLLIFLSYSPSANSHFWPRFLVRAGTPGWIGSAVEEALRSVS